jgi:hypothetical protein
MNNSPERRVNGYVISQSKIHLRIDNRLTSIAARIAKNFFENKKAPGGALKKIIVDLDGSYSRSNRFHSSHPNWFTLDPPHKKHNADKYEEERAEEA